MKKILVVTSSFPRTEKDWWANLISNLYKFLPKNKYRITVLVPHSPEAKRNEVMFGMKIVRFPYFFPYRFEKLTLGSGILHGSRNGVLGKVQVFTLAVSEFFWLIYLLKKEKFDVIHAHWIVPQGFFAILSKFIFKTPVVIGAHGTDVFGVTQLNIIKKISLKYCNICTANSKATTKGVLDLYQKTKVKLLPEGVDLTAFNPDKKNNKWREKFGNGDILIGVGRLIKCKGFEYLIRAMPKVLSSFPKSKLVIVGVGPEEKSLKSIAMENNLIFGKNIFFLGSIPHEDVSSVFASSDICIVPSIKDPVTKQQEGQGMVAIEALASGICVIASKSGGLSDIIDGKSTGLLTEEKNSNDIADKILILLKDKKYRQSLAKKGRVFVANNYDWKKISKNLSEIYEEVVTSNL